jgi:catalase
MDIAIFNSLKKALTEEGAQLEVIAPHVGGVEASDGSWVVAAQKVDGGPSVLYDAVALLPSAHGVKELAKTPAARDFVADAFAHCKFIGYVQAALPLLEKAGVAESLDEGFVALDAGEQGTHFVVMCRQLRFWEREAVMQNA